MKNKWYVVLTNLENIRPNLYIFRKKNLECLELIISSTMIVSLNEGSFFFFLISLILYRIEDKIYLSW